MSQESRDPALRSFYQKLSNDAYNLTLKGSKHNTFADFSLIFPLFSTYSTQQEPPIKQTLGSIEPCRSAKVINDYTLAFFNRYLKNQDESLLKRTSPDYPEVKLESRRI